ncbi:hypothetical protein D3C73_1272020 [compost metagenome]
MHAQSYLGVGAQLRLHLALIDFAVRPVLLTFRYAGTDHADQGRRLGDLVTVVFIGSPIGAQRQGNAVAVLPVHQHVFVHQQINQGQCFGEQDDNQHQPQGAGEETLGEPHGGFHG